jgi:hypothetical protein
MHVGWDASALDRLRRHMQASHGLGQAEELQTGAETLFDTVQEVL